MSSTPIPRRGERGVALVMALLVLLVLSMLAAVLMAGINTETKIAGRSLRQAQALDIAQAGVGEALARIKNFEIESNGATPSMKAFIFNAVAGSVPSVGANTTALATAQPAGAWLNYSTATLDTPNVLTVKYKTDPAQTMVYRYDRSKNPPVQTATGFPIFVITSTGRVGREYRRIRAEIIQKPFNVTSKAALEADVNIQFSGTAEVCGYNHKASTPVGTAGVHDSGGPCFVGGWETGSNNLYAGWSTGVITNTGASNLSGGPGQYIGNQTGFYAGPWEALGMTQAEFYSWIGPATNTVPPNPQGIIYLGANQVPQDAVGTYGLSGGNGEGLLYIDGNCIINGNFTYKGMIYIEGDLQINGTCWILGGIVCKGNAAIHVANGTCTILYSKDAIEQNISKYGGMFTTLSWSESN